MRPRQSTRPPSRLDEHEAQQPLRWAFHSYLDCNLFLVRPVGTGWRWSLLFRAWNEDSPIHLEHRHGRREERIAFDRRRLNACLRSGKPAFSGLHGLYDLLVPVRQAGRSVGVLLAGPMRLEPPSADELRRHWRAITGRNAVSNDPELMAFARLHYRLPCVGRRGLRAIQRMLQLYAATMGQPAQAVSGLAWEKAAGSALTSQLGHRFWASSVVGQGPFDFPARWSSRTLMPVESGPMRFSGPARAVLIAEPVLNSAERDPLNAMAAGALLQRVAFKAARAQDDVEAVRLDDRRTLFLLRPRTPGVGPAVEGELSRSASAWKARLERDLGRPVRIRAGAPVDEWAPLRPSLMAALGQEGAVGGALSGDWASMANAEHAMGTALQGRDLPAFRDHARSLARQFEALSFGQSLVLKQALFGAMARLVRAQGLNLGLGESSWDAFLAERMALEAAQESRAMLNAFDAWVDRLSALRADPSGASRAVRMDRLQQALRFEPQRAWTLKEAAREAGYSPAAFSRAFKAWQGLGFKGYLQTLRLQAAAARLRESDLPIVDVAALSGYLNPSHFGRLFKKAWGLSPLAYRQRSSKNRTSTRQK